MIVKQGMLFLIYIMAGVIIGIVFDFFRSLRKSIKTSNLATYIEDVVFWIIVGFIIINTILRFNYGELRLYIFVGMLIGGIIYFLTLSKLFIKLTTSIIKFVVMFLEKFKDVFLKIFKRPINFIIINIRKFPIKRKNKKKRKYDKNLSKIV